MKVRIRNLGPLKEADFEVGDLTIICGENNTGKTYATYALYSFLVDLSESSVFKLMPTEFKKLASDGSMKIEIDDFLNRVREGISSVCAGFPSRLHHYLSAPQGRFERTTFELEELPWLFNTNVPVAYEFPIDKGRLLTILLDAKNARIELRLDSGLNATRSGNEEPELDANILEDSDFVINVISSLVNNISLVGMSGILPQRAFIASTERTGVVVFRHGVNLGRMKRFRGTWGDVARRLRNHRWRYKEKIPDEILYPEPVEANLGFLELLESISKMTSQVAESHPNIVSDFADLLGGEPVVSEIGVGFIPKGYDMKLGMVESSSCVRSLIALGFWLRHQASEGDMLMIDEPELNLHPENQRKMARLLARLVNVGIKVFVTTHSDYIIRELNTLLMLNHDKPHLKKVMEVEGYKEQELLKPEQVRVYVTQPMNGGEEKNSSGYKLVPADIDPELGIEVSSFDTAIETMNRIQDEIIWGAQE
ncbi:MAG: ATP-binding protein [Planctomycetes bacterium]|nr:ATP-binding protein [Planctomycetota bacterium]